MVRIRLQTAGVASVSYTHLDVYKRQVLFANFAESVAEGRGKAQAASLKKTQKDTTAHLLGSDAVSYTHLDVYKRQGNAWYYCNSSGAMLANTRTPDGYYVGANGAWIQ